MNTVVGTKLKLDLACGQNRREGFHGIDIVPDLYEDEYTVLDLNDPLPYEDDSVEAIHCAHFVEHVPDLIRFMNECYRVLEDGGMMQIVHPFQKSDRAFQDPTHIRFIPDAMWFYFSKGWREDQKLDHYPIHTDFEVVNIAAAINEPWVNRSLEAQQFAAAHYWNVISDLTVDLRAIKT